MFEKLAAPVKREFPGISRRAIIDRVVKFRNSSVNLLKPNPSQVLPNSFESSRITHRKPL